MHCSTDLDREEHSACSRTSDITDMSVNACTSGAGRPCPAGQEEAAGCVCCPPACSLWVTASALASSPSARETGVCQADTTKRSSIWQAACTEQSSSLGNQFYKHPSSLRLQKGPPASVLCVIWSVHCLHFVPSNCSSLTIKQWCSSASYRCRTEDLRENYLIQDQAGCLLQGKNSASQP